MTDRTVARFGVFRRRGADAALTRTKTALSGRVTLEWHTGTDDAVAILVAALHPDLDLPTCVLTLVAGQVAFEQPGALT